MSFWLLMDYMFAQLFYVNNYPCNQCIQDQIIPGLYCSTQVRKHYVSLKRTNKEQLRTKTDCSLHFAQFDTDLSALFFSPYIFCVAFNILLPLYKALKTTKRSFVYL